MPLPHVATPEHVAFWVAVNQFRDAKNLIAREKAVVVVEDALLVMLKAFPGGEPAGEPSITDRFEAWRDRRRI